MQKHALLRSGGCMLAMAGLVLAIAILPTAKAADEVPAAKFVLEWGTKGEGPGEFHSPIGLAFNSRDELFVTDLNNARVQKFSTDGKYLGQFAVPRDKPERKSTILGGIAIADDDLIYLTYMVQNKVSVYRENGEVVREWGTKGAGDGELNQPGGILFPQKGTVLICDQCNHRMQTFTTDGKYLGQWGSYGKGEGQFDGLGTRGSRFGGPHFVARDRQGRLYTTEGMQGRVQQFASDGKFLASWGDKGEQPGGFGAYRFGGLPESVGPIGIAIDPFDRILVSSLNNRVQFFESTGKYLFGITGTGLENDELLHPHGMAFDRRGFLYICDAGNQRILKFEIPAR